MLHYLLEGYTNISQSLNLSLHFFFYYWKRNMKIRTANHLHAVMAFIAVCMEQ